MVTFMKVKHSSSGSLAIQREKMTQKKRRKRKRRKSYRKTMRLMSKKKKRKNLKQDPQSQ